MLFVKLEESFKNHWIFSVDRDHGVKLEREDHQDLAVNLVHKDLEENLD